MMIITTSCDEVCLNSLHFFYSNHASRKRQRLRRHRGRGRWCRRQCGAMMHHRPRECDDDDDDATISKRMHGSWPVVCRRLLVRYLHLPYLSLQFCNVGDRVCACVHEEKEAAETENGALLREAAKVWNPLFPLKWRCEKICLTKTLQQQKCPSGGFATLKLMGVIPF